MHERNVVVDRLRDADDADRQTAPRRVLADGVGPAKGPVAADGEEDSNTQTLERVDHHCRILRPARRAEKGAAHLVNPIHDVRRQWERIMTVPFDEAFETEAE